MTTHTPIRSRATVRRTCLVLLSALCGGLLASALTATPNARSSAGTVQAATAHTAGAAPTFGYPVKPFHREHPIRAYLGEPRMIFRGPPTRHGLMESTGSFSFHQGVDIFAPNGTAVYPVASGTVSRVSTEWVRVDSGGGSAFEYWHIHPLVSVGQHVHAYATVLGHIRKPEMHVHLTQYQHGRVVNPLAPGHLGPFTDTTKPQVHSITIVSNGGSNDLPNFVRGQIRVLADASDLPTKPVPGIWGGLPTIPERLTWRIQHWTGKVVDREHTAFDFRSGVPSNTSFWNVYARGTYQNMAVFGPHYSYLQPGDYLFRLTHTPFDTRTVPDGVYDIVVTATDMRGNHGSLSQRFTVHNRPGWIGS
jgi:Peptidase family M23